jgi:Heterokaryon incompatibility protein (HET)
MQKRCWNIAETGNRRRSARNKHPFLYISQGESSAYTALSHCWGSTSLLRTTKSNIDDHKKEFTWIAFSQSFQDAITITQDLYIRYLWIDSICILQDDIQDWEAESGHMANIYGNARIVLAATDAKDGRDGLLSRSPIQQRKDPFTMTT